MRLTRFIRRRYWDEERARELQAYLEAETDDNIARGMSADEARYAAQRKLGNTTLILEDIYRMNSLGWLETLWQDLRYGVRQLFRNPGFTAVAVLSLALGIGANTAIFSLIDAVMLRMLPVRNPRQLVLLEWSSQAWPGRFLNSMSGSMEQDKSGRNTSTSFSYPSYEHVRDANGVFSSVTALAASAIELSVGFNGQPGRVHGELVSGTFFSTVGVEPALGRVLSPDDDRFGADPVAVVSYGYWQGRLGGDASAVGHSLTVNGVPFILVGVSPPEFFGVRPGQAVEIWLPLHCQPLVEPSWSLFAAPQKSQLGPLPIGPLFTARDDWWVLILARLKPAVSRKQAKSDADLSFQQSLAADMKPGTKTETVPHVELQTGSKGLDYLRGRFSQPLFILMAVVGLVLLIACANVANLMLARATTRQKEIAVRLATGARRGRLIRQLLTESVLLAGLGGGLGLVLAFWGTRLLVALVAGGRDPITLSVAPDPSVLGFTAALSIFTGILCGLFPALRSTRVDLSPALKESIRTLESGFERNHRLGLGKTLVIAQVALSVVLLAGAILFVRTLTNLESVNAGFNQHNLLLFGIDPSQDGYKSQRLAELYRELLGQLGALPGVRSVSISMHGLIGGGASVYTLRMAASPPKLRHKGDQFETYVNRVGPRFFESMGIPLLLGRDLGDADTAAAPKVAVVNEKFVSEFLGGENPIDRRFGFGDAKTATDYEIVGLVGNAKYTDLRTEVPATVYLPYQQDLDGLGAMVCELRTAGNPLNYVSAVARVAKGLDPNLALYNVWTQEEQIDESLSQERLFARLTSFFGVLAAMLACVGIYGIMAFTVTHRTREIGIRMAMGASSGEITQMVLGEALLLVGIGIVVGIALALGAARLIASLLYGLRPTDPLTLVLTALLMLGAAALAGYLPSRKASQVDPMVALRHE